MGVVIGNNQRSVENIFFFSVMIECVFILIPCNINLNCNEQYKE